MVVERKPCNIPPEFCPQAVIDWYNRGDENRRGDAEGREVSRKAKGHLSAVGWTFWFGLKNDRWELRYSSPSGKSHYSLRTACKSCIDAGGANPDSTPAAAVVSLDDDQGRLVPEKVETFSQENITTSPKTSVEYFLSTNSNSATSLSPKKNRKRKIDFESVNCEPTIHDHQTPQEQFNDKIIYSQFVDQASEITDSKSLKEKRTEKGNDERMRKIPNKRGRGPQSKRSILGALIDNNALNLGAKVSYRGKPRSGGTVTREGIKCDCCSVVFALTAFEDHVGSTNHRPAANILLEDGRSLADCKTQKKPIAAAAVDNSDDICGVCQYGGKLVLCDGCPSAYHPGCLGYEAAPDGDWFCPSCRCGVCGHGSGVTMTTCRQCERKFHAECLPGSGRGGHFCGRKCEEVCSGLRELAGKTIDLGRDGLSWTMLRSGGDDPRIEAALAVMHQCFEPARDPLTKRDIVEDVFRGTRSELSRLNFGGFHVVVLEREGETVSVAAVRVCGGRLAEVPLVATGFKHRRKGLCRVLMDEVERRMAGLGVERLILPAAACVLRTWVDSFGFSEMSSGERLEFLCYNPLDFQGTVMCQKLLLGETEAKANPKPRPLIEDLPAEAKEKPVNGNWKRNSRSRVISGEPFMRDQGRRIVDMAAKVAAL